MCVVFSSLVYSCVEAMLLLSLMCIGTPELRVFDLVRMVSLAGALRIDQDYGKCVWVALVSCRSIALLQTLSFKLHCFCYSVFV